MIHDPICVGKQNLSNRVVLQPMEGCDCMTDGSPSELTVQKYIRAAKSGAGLVWFEANAVCPEGRTNPRQMMLTRENLPAFRSLLQSMRKIALEECGVKPVFILQLTHSGRQSVAPMIAYRHPIYEKTRPVGDESIVTDEYLDTLPALYAASATLAVEAGFDGVDVKSCHGYLLQELLSAFCREGRYGGSFENRTRFFREIAEGIQKAAPGLELSARISIFDIFPFVKGEDGVGKAMEWEGHYPYAFGGDGTGRIAR